jgi:transcriptional regulator with XRE-family HTH domain
MSTNYDYRSERAAKGLSQAQVAKALGVNQSTIARWEENPSLMKPFMADAVRRAIEDAPAPDLYEGMSEAAK